MLFENIRVVPLELKNHLTGEMKVLLPGEVMDLPEGLGRIYSNYLRPVEENVGDSELFIEDIQNDIVSEFNPVGDLFHSEDVTTELTPPTIETKVTQDNVLIVEEEKKEKKSKGRPKVYSDISAAEKRKLQRQKKKETEAKFKNLEF